MAYRRNRRKMTTDEIFDSEKYRSIIYQTEIYGKKNGLRQADYRWVLIEKHDKIRSPHILNEIRNFYKINDQYYKKQGYSDKLSKLYSEKTLIKNCISSNTSLSYYLKRLSSDPYNILEKKIRDNVSFYFMTEYGREQMKRWQINNLIKGIPKDLLDEVEQAIWDALNKKIDDYVKYESK